ncbi:MAG: hypothetical protein U0990_11910 [Candidatus Nanopelagicales bacterium]|nr:hypothetical protein [Candidatus Nanopelagicales bacterium]
MAVDLPALLNLLILAGVLIGGSFTSLLKLRRWQREDVRSIVKEENAPLRKSVENIEARFATADVQRIEDKTEMMGTLSEIFLQTKETNSRVTKLEIGQARIEGTVYGTEAIEIHRKVDGL